MVDLAFAPAPRLPPALQLAWFVARPLDVFEHCARTIGPTFHLDLPGLGRTVFVSLPDDVRAVFSADTETVRAGEGNTFLRPVVGKRSLLTLDGAAHRREKKLIAPALHGERITTYTETIRARASAHLERIPAGAAVRLRDVFKRITLEIIAEVVFGATDAVARDEAVARFGDLADVGNSPLLLLPQLRVELAGIGPWARARRAIEAADAFIFRRIRAARDAARATNDEHAAIVDLLAAARDVDGEAMSEEAIRDELVTLLLAGHETTATALAWLFAHVAGGSSRDTARDALEDPRWLDAAIQEALRITPVLGNVNRRLRAPLRIASGELPAGVYASPCIYLAHRRSEAFVDPTRFSPERFLSKEPAPNTYFPFGGGARRCVGMALALLEMREIARVFFTGATWTRRSRSAPRPARRGITIAPQDGAWMVRSR